MLQFIAGLVTVMAVGVVFALLTVTHECRQAILKNCRRLDGSWSPSRARRERGAFTDYLTSLSVPLLLAVPLSLFCGLYVLENYMPAHQIADAFANFSPNEGQWKEGLTSVREDHRKWLAGKGMSTEDATAMQQALWYGWPFLAVVATSVVVFTGWAFLGVSRAAVADYASGVRNRREGYARLDVLRMMGHGEVLPTCPAGSPTGAVNGSQPAG